MSIEAVAARAGVSKGGLLYHFPTKQALLRALVTEHVDAPEPGDAAATRRRRASPIGAGAGVSVGSSARKLDHDAAAAVGLFAAIAEDPEFIAPMRAFRASMLDDVFRRCPNPDLATVVFLATEGMVFAKLTDPQASDGLDLDRMFASLKDLLDAQPAPR